MNWGDGEIRGRPIRASVAVAGFGEAAPRNGDWHERRSGVSSDGWTASWQQYGEGVARMTDRRSQDIWKVQCDAAEVIKLRHGVESAFDYVVGEKLLKFAEAASDDPELARALPRFVSRVRRMFTPEEIEIHLARIQRRRREQEIAAMEDGEREFESPRAAAERERQFGLVKELLTAPALGTS